uniref:Fatty acyl-CoA reductase C-terminal domain-containing protein n=1 Tax=Megaselia scalaris TaxID=36166 RepID=T1GYC4_MEGSC
MVPADYCVNAILSCAWDCFERHEQRLHENIEIPVYNYIFDKNNLTWGQYMSLSRQNYTEPFEKAFWCFTYTIIPSKFIFKAMSFLLHDIPGYMMDGICFVTGQKR